MNSIGHLTAPFPESTAFSEVPYLRRYWLSVIQGSANDLLDINSFITLISFIYRRRQWHPTPVLLPGKFHGRRSLGGCSPWGREESDVTERLHFHFSLSCFTFMHWRRKWQPTPVFLPGESQGQGSLVGCRLWGHTDSDMTEAT